MHSVDIDSISIASTLPCSVYAALNSLIAYLLRRQSASDDNSLENLTEYYLSFGFPFKIMIWSYQFKIKFAT